MLAALFLAATLVEGFVNPPRSAAPHTWWHWMNGNVTKEGITADLEAMKKIGLAGAQTFDCDCSVPIGPIAYNSPEWFEMILHAHKEAKRLGLQLTIANCSGYSSSAGPWVRIEDSMKKLVWTETRVKGPVKNLALPPLPNPHGLVKEIATYAFPTPKGYSVVTDGLTPKVTTNKNVIAYTFSFPEKRTFDEVQYTMATEDILWGDSGDFTIKVGANKCPDQISPNDQYETVPRTRFIGATTADSITVKFVFKEAWALYHAKLQDVRLGSFGQADQYAALAYHSAVRLHESEPPRADIADFVVDPKTIVPFTGSLPMGDWTILQIGCAASGRHNHPATKPGFGLEVDKLNAAAVERHFDAYVGKLVKLCEIDPKSDPTTRFGFVSTLVDSYEVGAQNWTDGFEKVFEEERGYAIGKFLPALVGWIVESPAATEKFLCDFHETVAEAFARNYSDVLARKCTENGILLSLEPYGCMPSTIDKYARSAQWPMTEFWARKPEAIEEQGMKETIDAIRRTSNAKIIGAEAFTTMPEDAGWSQTPWDYKAMGDYAYTLGVNRIVYHRFAHQPWTNPTRYPGMTMGFWGTNFDRTQTWWDMAGDWIKYETRCQWMLQEGEFVEDRVCPFASGEKVNFIHRRYPAENTDAWFVATPSVTGAVVTCALPEDKRSVELWDPESGEITPANLLRSRKGRRVVELNLGPCGSAFVVLTPTPSPSPSPSFLPPYAFTLLPCHWTVSFPPDWGAPATYELSALTNLSEVAESGVKYFSGTMTYRKTITFEAEKIVKAKRITIDLGKVAHLARVKVNGIQSPRVAWKPPYVCDITEGAKQGNGELALEIEVANLWQNRIIGDEREFESDVAWRSPRRRNTSVKEIPEFVKKGEKSPTGRFTFMPCRALIKSDPLPPSGLLGPVTINLYF